MKTPRSSARALSRPGDFAGQALGAEASKAAAREVWLILPSGSEEVELAAGFAARSYVVRCSNHLPGEEEADAPAPSLIILDACLAPSPVEPWPAQFSRAAVIILGGGAQPNQACLAARQVERPISPRALIDFSELLLGEDDTNNRLKGLLAKNQDMQRILDSSDQVYLLLDASSNIEAANRAAFEMAADFCKKPLVLGEPAFALLSPAIRRIARPHFDAAFAGKNLDDEIVITDIIGRKRFISVSYHPVFDGNGVVRQVFFRARDISLRRQTETNLRASQSRLQALFDHSHDAILLADDGGNYMDANPAACLLFGFKREELLALSVADVFAASERSWARQAWGEFLARGAQDGECRLLRKNGSIVRADYSAIARIQPGLHLTIFRDLTEKHALQAQLLRQQRLESVGRLASGVAHDLNNILTPILMAPAMLRPHLSDTGARMLLESVENAARRGSSVVRQLLVFSRSEPGEKVRIDLQKVVRDARAMLQESLPKSINLEFARSAGEFPVLGDATQLQQVVVNLALNGVDAMPRGGRLVFGLEAVCISEEEASQDPEVTAGNHVVLTIADHGHGIAPENIDRVFDPFFTTKPFGQGSGMGLSVVLGIIRGHGGHVRISSRLGVGTLVKVCIPLTADAAVAHQSANPFKKMGSVREAGLTVLVVDDESDVRDIVRMILAREGYRVSCADGADAAFGQLKANGGRVDLVITDLAMPGVSGAQLIERLRKQKQEIPILVMTGTDIAHFLPAEVREQTQGVLAKPFDANGLLVAVREAIATRS